MNTLEQWLQEQSLQGRHLYLMLESDGQQDECNSLARDLQTDQCRNLYVGTPADSLSNVGPYLFQIDSMAHPAIQALLKTPERHWGWLASSTSSDLDVLVEHWQARLIIGERPNQAVYRFHDNRVLTRALAHLQPEQRPDYLGPITSVCYWQTEQWSVADNPDPAPRPLPADPAWLSTPIPAPIATRVQFDNARRYLMREHTGSLLALAEQQDIDTWLRGQINLARDWGWQEPEQIHFLLTQSLQAADYTPPKAWLPQPHETPMLHFERLHLEALYWQGDAT